MKYFVISQPKAGTYLAANLLSEMGIKFEGLHFSLNSYQHYNLSDINESRKNRKKYTKKGHISETINLVKEGTVGVGHIECNHSTEEYLKNFKKILLVRDLESTIESWKDWAKITHKSVNSKLLDKTFRKNIAAWKEKSGIFVLDFYDMKNKNLKKIDELQIFLFSKIKYDSDNAISSALKKDSITKIKRIK